VRGRSEGTQGHREQEKLGSNPASDQTLESDVRGSTGLTSNRGLDILKAILRAGGTQVMGQDRQALDQMVLAKVTPVETIPLLSMELMTG